MLFQSRRAPTRRVSMLAVSLAALSGASGLVGCNALDDPSRTQNRRIVPTDTRPALQPDSPPPPLSGGTLAVARDGRFAAVADEARQFRESARLISECHAAGLAVITEVLPFGLGKTEHYTPENISFAVRAAAELGADVVKTAWPGDKDAFRRIVDACFVPVIVLGGAAGDDASILKMVEDAISAGASGIAIGRNVWQHPQLAARGRWTEVGSPAGPIGALKPPGRNAAYEPRMDPIPAVGQHNDAILRELGLAP